MRLTLFFALAALGGLAAGCGSTHQTTAAVKTVAAPAPPAPAHISFLAPSEGASVGSTVLARVRLVGTGRIQFILDGGPPRIADGLAFRLRHLRPGSHLLVAQLVPAGQATAVSATVRFRVRPQHVAAKRPPVVSAAATTPTAPATSVGASSAPVTHAAATRHVTTSAPAPAPSPAPTTSAPRAPAPAAAPPATHTSTSSPPAGPPKFGGGIPQGGGGDGDADNNGGPSDGDGNI
jgi:hypothetical protein